MATPKREPDTWHMLLHGAALRFPPQGVNHSQTKDRHFTKEFRGWLNALYDDIQILDAAGSSQIAYWYYDKDLAAAHRAARRKWPFRIEFAWHTPLNQLWKWDWDGMIKHTQDLFFSRVMGINDAWIQEGRVRKDAEAPVSFDVTIWALNVPSRTPPPVQLTRQGVVHA